MTNILTNWKLIDSAPQTGLTLLLGYWNSHGKWRTVRGRWMSLEYIAEHWEDPDDAEEGWFETAVEADDSPNCWRVTPSHWQPMPAPPCLTCGAHGMVGGLTQHSGYDAEPCPDCCPASTVATEGEKDGLAEAQLLAQALFKRHFSQDDDYISGRVKWEVLEDLPGVLSQIDNMVSGLVQPTAPAAGDALPSFDIEAAAQKMAECMDYPWAHMPEQGRTHMRKYAQAVIDAAIAQQSQRKEA